MHRFRSEILIAAFLGLTPLVVFWHVNHNSFAYDDVMYVTGDAEHHPKVQGLTLPNVVWAWTAQEGFWHPLTWMSLQLDYDLYGQDPSPEIVSRPYGADPPPQLAGCHLTNLAFHAVNAVLLFLALRWTTGSLWCSAFVAAFFALHPVNVEAWAWIAERKGVLSTFFWLLALLAYIFYAERPLYAKQPGYGRYALVLLALILGLLSKPMLVTVPFVFLLLDYWPLRRWRRRGELPLKEEKLATTRFPRAGLGWLLVEKVPLLVVVGVFSLVAWWAQEKFGALGSLTTFPLAERFENAAVSYVKYLGKAAWPTGLIPFYPHPSLFHPDATSVLWQAALASGLLLAITALVLWWGKTRPYLAVGWLWFLGTLVPVIGLVQVGGHGMADRYLYVPLIGLLIMAVWAVADLAARWHAEKAAATLAGILLLACLFLSGKQVERWKDDATLWQYTLAVNDRNPVAHYNYAQALSERQDRLQHLPELIEHFGRAAELNPQDGKAFFNKGLALEQAGQFPAAIDAYRAALAVSRGYPRANLNLGLLLLATGKPDEAEEHLRKAIPPDQENPVGYYLLGEALAQQILDGKNRTWEEVRVCFAKAWELQPNLPRHNRCLGYALYKEDNLDLAKERYQAASRADRDWLSRCNAEAWARATHPDERFRNALVALELAEQVCQATDFSKPEFLDTLAAAQARVGKFEDAAHTAQKALQLIGNSDAQKDLRKSIADRLEQYRQKRAFRDERLASAGPSMTVQP